MSVAGRTDDDRSLHEAITTLDRSREVLRQAVETVPGEQRQDRPAPAAWSVVEVLEHLDLVDAALSGCCSGRRPGHRRLDARLER